MNDLLNDIDLLNNKPIVYSEAQSAVVIAIGEDNIDAFTKLKMPIEELAALRFHNDFNILNFAIDEDKPNFVKYLAEITAERPDIQQALCNNKFGQYSLSAVHQVVTVGKKQMIDCLIHEFKADFDVKTNNELSVMHFAAQHYIGYLTLLILVK